MLPINYNSQLQLFNIHPFNFNITYYNIKLRINYDKKKKNYSIPTLAQ